MNCTEFEDRLHDQFDAAPRTREAGFGLSMSADAARHAVECETCRGLYERFQLLADCLGAWREQIPVVDFAEAVVRAHVAQSADAGPLEPGDPSAGDGLPPVSSLSCAQTSAGKAGRSGHSRSNLVRRHRLWLVAASLTAVATLTIVVSKSRQLPPDLPPLIAHAPDGQVSDRDTDAGPEERLEARADDPARDAGDAGVPYYELAQKAAGALDEVAMFMAPGAAASGDDSERRVGKGSGWIDGLQHQLKPIGRSLDDAFDFLWQAGQSADPSKT
jgi:hypothetical protein